MEAQMIKLTVENTRKAVERVRALRPRLEYLGGREWLVFSGRNSAEYVVRLQKIDRQIFAECTCKGAARGFVCYHAVAAVTCQMGVARARQMAAAR